eukprot:scaffold104896_cov90-Phaeocystis_antarctica.AAC.1
MVTPMAAPAVVSAIVKRWCCRNPFTAGGPAERLEFARPTRCARCFASTVCPCLKAWAFFAGMAFFAVCKDAPMGAANTHLYFLA